MKSYKFSWLIISIHSFVLAQNITTLPNSNLPLKDGRSYLPDVWLLSTGQSWHFRTAPALIGKDIGSRLPNDEEKKIIGDARDLLEKYEMKLVALIDDGKIIDMTAKDGISLDSLLLSASMAKTVTAVAIGKAICENKIHLDTKAGELVPSLKDKDLGKATLRDLMIMASGVTEPQAKDVSGITQEEVTYHLEGKGSLEELVSSTRLSTFQKSFFSTYKPGERFSYKSVDPFTASLMLQYAVGMPATQWVNEKLFKDIPIKNRAILGTDKKGNFSGAMGSVRLTLIDWVRFATYIQQERGKQGCFSDYLKDMSKTQIKLQKIEGVNGYFGGYGYFTWTEADLAPNTFWAAGYGGQRIGWSNDPSNKRIFITFGNSSDKDMNKIYPVANRWINLR